MAGFRGIAACGELPSAWREALRVAMPAGIQLTERLVVNLRFDRVRAASARAREEFAADPRGFAQRFAAFCREVPPREWHPVAEARAFEAFRGGV